MDNSEWKIVEPGFDASRLHQQETVFTIGNGYLGTRGAFEEGYGGQWPATLINGVYDDVDIFNTELANGPDWLPMAIFVDGERFRLDRGQLLSYRRELDMGRGLLTRQVRWQSPAGKTVEVRFERFASMADPHVLALSCEIMPVGQDAEIQVQAGISSYVFNHGMRHWEWLDQGGSKDAAWLLVETLASKIEVSMATRLAVSGCDSPAISVGGCPGYPIVETRCEVGAGQTIRLDKHATVYTAREAEDPEGAAREKLNGLADYSALRGAHEAAWERVWADNDIVIAGDATAQKAVRYNLFQLLIAAPWHDDRVSIPAKTLSGVGYRGHIFWDTELFVAPLFIYTQREVARNLLTYRYHTLPGARRKAKALGFDGAMFAWESAATGDEVTPQWVLDPRGEELVRIWPGEIEIHINADVAYAVWQYWQVTGDDDWMARFGAEILLDSATFWGERVTWNEDRGQYEILDVIGPDEYHEHVDNNAFTNRMAKWHLERALDVLVWLRDEHPELAAELEDRLGLTKQRLQHWADVIGCIRILHDLESDLIEQFEGFFELEDVNLEEYEPRTRSIHAILGIEGANRAQVLKQPDVLMLLYALQDNYDQETLQVNWDYYTPRTDHTYGSSLGPAIHAILACELDKPDVAYKHFMRAALVDLEDVRGNSNHGIHGASAGGVWQAVVFGFAGVREKKGKLVAAPCLPAHWRRVKFRVQHRGEWQDFDLRAEPRDIKPEFPIEGVIFDLDGVITDTAEFHYQGWQRLADEEGIRFGREANEALRGLSRRASLLQMLGGQEVDEQQLQEMMARKNKYYRELIEQVTAEHLLPGAEELLKEVKQAGLKVAIGSASKNARPVIEQLGIGPLIDAITDGYSVERHKPAPDLFLHAAALIGVAPSRCVVFEDATSGVEAGRMAGMWTVGIGPADRVGEADLVLPDLKGAGWSDIIARLKKVAAERDWPAEQHTRGGRMDP